MDAKVIALIIVFGLFFLIIAAGMIYVVVFMDSGVNYVCSDGTIVSDPVNCPTTTTTEFTLPSTIPTTQVTTIVITEATSIPTTEVTTTLPIACGSDLDCGGNVNSSPYCVDFIVKEDILKSICLNPGGSNAKCGFTPTGRTNIVDECDSNSEFCSDGACVLRSCVNGMLDEGEDRIDCGGVCPNVCDSYSITCNTDSDCQAKKKCVKDYFCDETNPAYLCYYQTCINPGATDSSCVNATETIIHDICGLGKHCEEGRGVCIDGGNCRDCIRNQDEERVDCGGLCQDCAVMPDDYTIVYLSGANRFRDYYTDQYGNVYEFILNKVLVDNCPIGAKIRLDKDGYVIASFEVDKYTNTGVLPQNNNVFKFEMGLINVTSSTARIWVREPN